VLCRPLLLPFCDHLEYVSESMALFQLSNYVDSERLGGFVMFLNREEECLTFKVTQLPEHPVNEIAVGFRFGHAAPSLTGVISKAHTIRQAPLFKVGEALLISR